MSLIAVGMRRFRILTSRVSGQIFGADETELLPKVR